jgi:hypothetical protein
VLSPRLPLVLDAVARSHSLARPSPLGLSEALPRSASFVARFPPRSDHVCPIRPAATLSSHKLLRQALFFPSRRVELSLLPYGKLASPHTQGRKSPEVINFSSFIPPFAPFPCAPPNDPRRGTANQGTPVLCASHDQRGGGVLPSPRAPLSTLPACSRCLLPPREYLAACLRFPSCLLAQPVSVPPHQGPGKHVAAAATSGWQRGRRALVLLRAVVSILLRLLRSSVRPIL